MSKTVLFQSIQFSICTQFSSIWPIDRTLSGVTTPGQSGSGSDGNEGELCIPQSSSITGTSSSDCLVSYSGHSLVGGSYPSAEKQSVYSTAPADWAREVRRERCMHFSKAFALKWNLKSLVQDLNLARPVYFLKKEPLLHTSPVPVGIMENNKPEVVSFLLNSFLLQLYHQQWFFKFFHFFKFFYSFVLLEHSSLWCVIIMHVFFDSVEKWIN